MGCLNEPIMIHILMDRHVRIGRKKLIDIVGMIIQVRSDLLVVDIGGVVFVDEGQNACHLGVCGFGVCGAGAQDLADNGLQQSGAVGLQIVSAILHLMQYGT